MSIDDERIFLPTSPANHLAHALAYAHALPFVRGRKVADLCCGTGYGTRLLSEAANWVTGYDYSEDAIKYNNERKLYNTEFIQTDVEKLTELDVDIITCMQGLEHLDKPKELIARFRDTMWLFALPNDMDDTNEHHHHKITERMIRDWFGANIRLYRFDDAGNWNLPESEYFSNWFGVFYPDKFVVKRKQDA